MEYLSNTVLEFGVFVVDPYLLSGILQEIESLFPQNRIIETSLFQKEYISVGLPKCVFV